MQARLYAVGREDDELREECDQEANQDVDYGFEKRIPRGLHGEEPFWANAIQKMPL